MFRFMRYVCDFHIHSKYARACSPLLTLENIDKYCKIKGVDIIATGDFTHPAWFKSMKEELVEAEPGLYAYNGSKTGTRFICSVEISCIYSKGGKVRRLHIVVVAPSIEVAGKINEALSKIGNLAADGRPILGLDAKRLAEIVWEIDERVMFIPAHVWTPWFAIFGSKSGFDSVEECYEELSGYIYALETGLSSDPPMNWRVSSLDKYLLVSDSDAHSLPNLAREANIIEMDPSVLSFDEIRRILKEKDTKKFVGTIEFYPDEGMYHWDGHRNCKFSCKPSETKKHNGICPKCKKSLTLGVEYRVEELADRKEGYVLRGAPKFMKLVELDKIIAEVFGVKSRTSKKVQTEFDSIISKSKNELDVLINAPLEDLKTITLPEIVEGIKRVREQSLIIEPGFDGQYGKVKIFSDNELGLNRQKSLF